MANLMTDRERRYMWDPFHLVRDFYSRSMFEPGPNATFAPDFEVKERAKDYVIHADVPGIKEKDIDITMSGNCLTISGHREASEKAEDEHYFAYERQYGSFSRSFTLPPEANPEDIEADLDSGVLTIKVGKSPESQPKKISLKERVKKALTS